LEHDTDVATPATPSAPDTARDAAAAERAAAFRRGAPTPRTESPPAAQKPEPKPKRTPPARQKPDVKPVPKAKPEPGAQAKSAPGTAEDTPTETSRAPRPRQPRRRAPEPAAETTQTVPTETPVPDTAPAGIDRGAAASQPNADGASRKRSRRGGRGRGRGSASGASRPQRDAGAPEDEPIVGETPDTQRDDALPDEATASAAPTVQEDADGSAPARSGSRRRRGSRGSGVTKRPADAVPSDGDGSKRSSTAKPAEAKPKGSRAKAKPLTVEEQVASGGPTRGIRSTRSRTGRGTSGRTGDRRRRRDPVALPPRITDKLMVITEHGDRDQIAVLEQDTLVQHYVTRTGATSMVGNVYLGRVQNVLPGMEAAFVDIGRGRNGVLYAGEVNYTPEDLEGPAPRIEQVLKAGQAVVVQVTKDPMGGKGARLTAQISLPGRYLVFAPEQSLSGISRRLPDEERKRLKSIMRAIKPDGDGVIVRTAAEGAPEENLTHDLQRLVRQWEEIGRRAKKVKAPEVLSEEPELTVRVFRDLFTDEEYRELVTDSPRVYDKIMGYVRDVAPDLEPKVRLHQGKLSAFEEHRIVEQIQKALDRKVWLPSGGYLIIERTEAMTIVDVNTGKSVGKTNLEETVVNTNLEAAAEVARQLRLRDIGGIIVIDFIDMLLEKNKKQVEDIMRDALAIDKTRSQVFEIGPLGLLQVTRKRVSGGLVESFSETCPTCEGRGILLNYEA
jgi:ribonuclease E